MTPAMNLLTMEQRTLTGRHEAGLIRDMFSTRELISPLLLLSRGEVGRRYAALKAALPRVDIHYAVKSNNHPVILEEVRRQGGSFDVCSAGEIGDVLKTGIKPAALIHSHPIKSRNEFDQAVAAGIELFVVDNPDEVRKLRWYTDRKLKILVRFRVHTNTTAVVNLQYKFGCLVEEVLPLACLIEEAGHEFYGLCFHIGSQCIFADNYIRAIKAAGELIRELHQRGFNTRLLDIGGGFPVEYVEPVPTIDELCTPIRKALDRHIDSSVRLICEPGRYISATPITLICSVIGKSVRDGKIWYYLDDGLYSTFSGILFDHCQYPVVCEGAGDEQLSVLAGPTCDSFDVMYDGLMIPEQEIGDLIAFPMTGAYCAVSGSDFNSLRRPEYRIID